MVAGNLSRLMSLDSYETKPNAGHHPAQLQNLKQHMRTKIKIKDRHSRSNGQGQGMNWIRKEKRLAIYLRDGLACCYCGQGIEDDAKLTLDHLNPHSKGGSNKPENLVTCCLRCNSSRGNRSWSMFASSVASYVNHGVTSLDITCHILATVKRVVDVDAAKALIARRGGFTAALNR